ncbi:leucine-rich repeat and guanylate kinase domain-containing protein-like isoform X1 [Ruditapes philippinarum]|uniref:leucine-rich repeat and guanylate kinase domain-containing protein-like isoform X1 n=1 Tax=Ruditapes philippinarum TaxID=129788 RepID=UPI00295B9786|nr:leucine-rich repeat and guanylate kinase domain-containing protein-like isoform X1 [Ruditapes philippinarum]
MADGGSQMMDNQAVEDGFVHINGETHVLNYDTNILNLEENRVVSPVADVEPLNDILTGTGSGDEEEEDIELSPGGILDEETVGRGLSNLGRSADGAKQVYLHCTIPGFNLIDIQAIANYTELQKIEIPYNQLTDLSPLSNLPFLLILDASHNKLSTVLDFKPPKNLKDVDLSFNEIEVMTDLSAHHYLTKLNLDNNNIKDIQGLEKCSRLKHLSLAHNKIETIKGLDSLPIHYLNLCHNKLTRIENLETLRVIQQINFSGNKIRSLKGLQDHDLLECLDLEDNEVIDITEIKYVKELSMLRQLNLLRNPIQELPDYRLSILYQIQRLTELDRHKVEVDEKVASVNMFNPPPEVIAARDHIMHVVYSFLQPSRVWDSTLPSIETPYPMLVLVGPQGSGKKDLALKLVEEFSDYFGYGISHTTRKPHKEETAGKDYHFVTEEKFEMDIKMGQFIQTYQYNGQWYGLQMESIESVAREGLACVVHMELEGVLTLKNTYFEPRYVLVMPLTEECHEKRLRDRGIYSEKQIEHTLVRADMYKTYNQNHPGFFDMMINGGVQGKESVDDIQEAYKRLRRLVMDYLGIGVPSPPLSDAGDMATDVVQRGDTDQNLTTQLGTRTWSKPSMSDTMSQSYNRPRGAQSPIISSRGIVEEASLKRRQSAAKDAVSGLPPPLLEQLLTSYPKTAPQSVEGQIGLGTCETATTTDPHRSISAPIVNKPQRPGSSDSSENQSRASSSLTGLTSASDIHRVRSPEAAATQGATAQKNTDKGPQLPTEMVNPIELMSDTGKEPRPPSAPRPPSQGSRNRPGSDKHKVLPPINNGRPIELM